MNPDPDPAFQVNPDPGFWWPKIEENFFSFWSKIAIYICPNLQPSKEYIQHFKKWNVLTFFYVCGSFLPSWIRIRIQVPHWIRIQNTGKKEINLKKEANLWKRYYFEEGWLPPVVGPVISSNVMNIISGGLNKARWRKHTKPPEYESFSNVLKVFLFIKL